MTDACLNQVDPAGLNATVEVRYKVLRPLQQDHAIITVQRNLVRAIQAGLVLQNEPIGTELVAKMFCGRHADKENTVVCALFMTVDGATGQDYVRYREELEANLADYLDEGILDFSLSDHEVDRVVTNVYRTCSDDGQERADALM